MSGSGGVNSLQTVDGKTVIVVEVSEDRQHPYYIKALGRDGGEVTSRASFFTILHGLERSQNLHKIISTHLLTVLIIRAIVQLEQRKREIERDKEIKKPFPSGLT